MSITITQALEASIILDAANSAHAADVQEVLDGSIMRGEDTVILDGSKVTAPAVHSAAAKVMLDTLDVEFLRTMGAHTVWRSL